MLDLMLPGTDGLEVCQRLRKDETLGGVPVIMLTARASEVDRVLGLELGADDYITKPFSPRELVARVRAVLRPQYGHPRAGAARGLLVRAADDGLRHLRSHHRRPGDAPLAARLRAPQVLRPPSPARLRAHAAPGPRVGSGHARPAAHGRRAHRPAAQADRTRRFGAAGHPHGARRRLHVRSRGARVERPRRPSCNLVSPDIAPSPRRRMVAAYTDK